MDVQLDEETLLDPFPRAYIFSAACFSRANASATPSCNCFEANRSSIMPHHTGEKEKSQPNET